MNQIVNVRLRDLMERSDGWGRDEGRALFLKLLQTIEAHPEATSFRFDLTGIDRMDASFPRESFVAIAQRFAGEKSFSLAGLKSPDLLDNIEAAANKRGVPIVVWRDRHSWSIVGPQPSPGLLPIFGVAMSLGEVTTAELIRPPHKMGAANNVSNKLKQLVEAGYLVRREESSPSGGKEYRYTAPRQ